MGQARPFGPKVVDDVDIRAELGQLLAHSAFRASRRNKRFLEFVVTETLEGRGERLKAYTIAVDVFGRGADFDPSMDPIVRIEANRLRLALENFYAGPGADAGLRVHLPKGKYIPSFVGMTNERAASCASGTVPMNAVEVPLALVEAAFSADRDDPAATACANLASELTIEGLRQRNVRVLYSPPARRVAARKAFDELLKNPGSAFAIDISVSACSLYWMVSSLSSSEILATERLEMRDGNLPAASDVQEAADRITQFVSRWLGLEWLGTTGQPS